MFQLARKWFTRLRRQRMRITLEGWYYLAIMGFVLVGALLRQINLLVVLYGLMVGPILISVRLVRISLRSMRLRRTVPRGVCAGQMLQVDLELTNVRRWFPSWCVAVHDVLRRCDPQAGDPIEAEVRFTFLPAGQSRKGFYRGRIEHRGRYRFGPVQLVTRFPFGLLRYTITEELPDSMIVYPALGRLLPAWQQIDAPGPQGSGRAERRHGPADGDFYGLRDWRHGDARSRIHWRTSARRQSLVVRQFERHRNDDLVLIVDAWLPAQPTPHERQRVETLLSAAATIVVEASRRQGRRIRLALAAAAPCHAGGVASLPLMHEILETLALARPAENTGLKQVLRRALQDSVHPARIVVLSTRLLDLADTHAWGDLLSNPRRGGVLARATSLHVDSAEFTAVFSAADLPAEPSARPGRSPREVQHAG